MCVCVCVCVCVLASEGNMCMHIIGWDHFYLCLSHLGNESKFNSSVAEIAHYFQ